MTRPWLDLVLLAVQWTISELACYTYSLVSVPLYDTLGAEAIDYIIDRGKVSAGTRARAVDPRFR